MFVRRIHQIVHHAAERADCISAPAGTPKPGAGGAGQAGGTEPEPGGWNRFQLAVEDLAATVDQLRLEGVTFRGQIVEGKGGRQILVEDPSGNPVELFQPSSS